MRTKIQDRDAFYSIVKRYTDFLLHRAYRRIEYVGLEKVPKDSAVIYAPNHANALMDALVILAIDEKPKVFVARADIFRNPKIARILYFLRIMPIMRIRDGMEEVRKNDVTIHKSADVLKDGVPFCILPEGTHRAKHSLLPLGKGIFRIAIEAQELLAGEMPVYVVPVGLEYGNYFRFRSTVLIQVGDPINVRDYMEQNSDLTRPELMNKMKLDLSDKMKHLILCIPDDEWYFATYELCALMLRQYITRIPLRDGSILLRRLGANRSIVSDIQALRADNPDGAARLLSMADEVNKLRIKKGISLNSAMSRVPVMTALWRLFILLLTCVYTIPMSILIYPITGLTGFLHKKMPDDAFFNSIRYAVQFVLWPVMLVIYGVILFCVFDWEWALALFILLVPAYNWCHDAYRYFRLLISDIKLASDRELRRMLKKCRRLYKRLMVPKQS